MCMGGGNCSDGVCAKCHAVMKVVIGGLILLNLFFIKWTGTFEKWAQFIAVLFIIKGVIKFIMPNCSHCKPETMAAKKVK